MNFYMYLTIRNLTFNCLFICTLEIKIIYDAFISGNMTKWDISNTVSR